MKYLFINSVAGFGSTGRIAAEQCRTLTAQGHTCVLAYGRHCVNCADITTHRIGSKGDYLFHGLMTRLLDNHGFGSLLATRRFLKWVKEYDPDVVWLHNIHGYYIHVGELFRYLRTSGKKVYWTLHDCWSFTGHCTHFSFVGCDRWKTGCHNCPQKSEYPGSMLRDGSKTNYRRKIAAFTGVPDLTVITPSQWLADRVKNSFLGAYPVEVRHNKVDRAVFKPTVGDFREKYGLTDKIVVLGVANVWQERKGLPDFVALSQLLPEEYKIVLLGMTPDQAEKLPEKILALPRTDSLEALAQAYSAADVYVHPSVEETFGMTALEAICCGTQVIVYQDTACQELVNAYGGLAVPRGVNHLLEAILSCERKVNR